MTHTIRAEPEIRFIPIGCTEHEHAYPTLDIEFEYQAGRPATGPTFWSGGEPAEGAELDLIHVTLIDGDGLDPTDAQLAEWAEDWLNDGGYDRACQLAEDESGPDPDAAYERMRDDREWDR